MAYDTPWNCWWNFDGENDYLELSHNADFDTADSGASTLMVGFRDDGPEAIENYSLVDKGRWDSGGDPGDFTLWLWHAAPALRYAEYHHHLVAPFGWGNCNVHDYKDGVNTCIQGIRYAPDGGNLFVFTFLDDVDGTDLSCNGWTNTANNFHGSSPLVIGARRTAPDTYSYYFHGRIYFVYWILGKRVGDSWPSIMCDPEDARNIGPWNYAGQDPNIYPSCLITFDQDVGSTYTPEIQSGPNAPYTFTVHGSPTKDCTLFDETSTTSILGHDFSVALDVNKPLGHQFTVPSRQKLLSNLSKITRKELGRRIY